MRGDFQALENVTAKIEENIIYYKSSQNLVGGTEF